MNTEELIKKSQEIFHNPNWDYSETVYKDPNTKIKIYCHAKDEFGNEHGYFEQSPYSHLAGHGCSKCAHRSMKYSVEEWLLKAKKINPHLDFILENYESQYQKVECICPKHGSFKRNAKTILQGMPCPQCESEKRYREKEDRIIEQCKKVHGDKYDYSDFVYHGMNTKSTVICPIHGPFQVRPSNHITNESGCPKCANEQNGIKHRMTTDMFIAKAKELHGDKYDYSKVEYIDNSTKVCIICPIHGEFWQTPHSHLAPQGCYLCGKEQIRLKQLPPIEEWEKRCRKQHGNKYIYEFPEEVDYYTKIKITCPIHGEFWQQVSNHANGQGCPKCKQSHLERNVELKLQEKQVDCDFQKRFDWLGKQSLDFYIPNANVAIECQGSQHFEKDKFYKDINVILERDERKRQLCQENGVELIYYLNEKYNKYVKDLGIPYFNDIDSLCEYIQGKTA